MVRGSSRARSASFGARPPCAPTATTKSSRVIRGTGKSSSELLPLETAKPWRPRWSALDIRATQQALGPSGALSGADTASDAVTQLCFRFRKSVELGSPLVGSKPSEIGREFDPNPLPFIYFADVGLASGLPAQTKKKYLRNRQRNPGYSRPRIGGGPT